MSQLGNAALASQGHENALPSPSLSSSDLPDDLPTPPTTPKAHLEVIRRVITENSTSKYRITKANTALLLSSLNALDMLMGQGEYLESALQSFKREFLAEIKSSAPPAPAAPTYASAASSSPATSPSRPPPAPKPRSKSSTTKTSDLTVIVDESSGVLSLPPAEIKAKVEAAIAEAGMERMQGAVRGVRLLSRGRLLVAVESNTAASVLKKSAAHWVPRIGKNCTLVVPRCQIIVTNVPTDFVPTAPGAAQHLYSHNRSSFTDASDITEMRWLNPKVLRDPKKRASSLLVTVSDSRAADMCIYQGVAVASAICSVHRYEEPPLVCYNCQQYGHTQHQCRQASPTCARCAGPHRSSNCPCSTSSTKCAPGKHCDHFAPRCTNCEGKHPSYHKECPVRIEEWGKQRERLRGRIFFNEDFDFDSIPPPPRDDSAPFFFAPPPAPAPSAPSP